MEAAYARAQADPRVGMAEPLAGLVADPLESELAAALADQARLGISNTSPSESTLVVEGIDPRGLGLVVVVSACATYPEGLAVRDLGSGEVVREVFPAGSQIEVVFAVRLDGVDGAEVHDIVSETLPASC